LLAQKNDRRTEFEDYNGIGFKDAGSGVFACAVYAFALRFAADGGLYGQSSGFSPALESGKLMLTLLVYRRGRQYGDFRLLLPALIVVMFFRERTDEWLRRAFRRLLAAVLVIYGFRRFLCRNFQRTAYSKDSRNAERVIKREK
jgi:hypothetical protein